MKNSKVKIKNIIAHEKVQMFPFQFIISYIVTPTYLILSLALLILFGVLMEIDEQSFFSYGLICLGTFAFLTIVILSIVPYFRKKAIRLELERYDFDVSNIDAPEEVHFSSEGVTVKFDLNGMYVNGEQFSYQQMIKTVETSNRYNRINIYLQFTTVKGWNIFLPITPVTLKMLDNLNIHLDNHEILDYIIHNKKDAFTQIYNKGTIHIGGISCNDSKTLPPSHH